MEKNSFENHKTVDSPPKGNPDGLVGNCLVYVHQIKF